MSNPPPTSRDPRADIDEALLRELTGQTDVRDPDHARALLGVALREEASAREQHERTRWPLRRARFRMLPVTMRMPPLVASLVLSSAIIFALAMVLIVLHFLGATVELIGLFALISLGYTIGFGVILYFLNDAPGENDDNRASLRRRALQAAVDARVASAAKVMRLEREAKARQELLDRVIAYGFELEKRRRQEQQKQQRQKLKSPPAPAPPSPPPPPPPPDPREPEYGGG